MELRNQYIQSSVSTHQDNTLVNSSLLQYPYGRGGLHESRMRGDESQTNSVDTEEYLEVCL